MCKRNRIVLLEIAGVVISIILLISLIYIAQRFFSATAQPINHKLSDVNIESTTYEVTETTQSSVSITTTSIITSTNATEQTIATDAETTIIVEVDEETFEETVEDSIEETNDESIEIDLSNLYISADLNVNETTGMSKEQFVYLMNNFSYDYNGLFSRNSGLIWDLCQEYNINEVFFVGLIGAESLWGSHEAHIATCNYTSIKSEGYLVEYSSEYEGLTASAQLICNKYFSDIGTTLDSISKIYCPDNPETFDIDESLEWKELVFECMKLFVSDRKNT